MWLPWRCVEVLEILDIFPTAWRFPAGVVESPVLGIASIVSFCRLFSDPEGSAICHKFHRTSRKSVCCQKNASADGYAVPVSVLGRGWMMLPPGSKNHLCRLLSTSCGIHISKNSRRIVRVHELQSSSRFCTFMVGPKHMVYTAF